MNALRPAPGGAHQRPLIEARGALLGAMPLMIGVKLLILAGSFGVPLFMMAVFDMVLAAQSEVTLAWLLGGLIIATIVAVAAEALRVAAAQAAGGRLAERLAGPAFDAAMRSGDTQALRDAETLRGFAASPAAVALLDAALAPLLLLVLALLAPSFAVFAVAVWMLLLAFGLAAERSARSSVVLANTATAATAIELGSAARGAEAVVGLGMLPALGDRWRSAEAIALALAGRAVRRSIAVAAMARGLRLLAGAGMVTLGALMVVDGSVTPGAMIAANLILARLLLPLESAAAAFRQFVDARSAWQRLDHALAAPQPRRDRTALPRPVARLLVDRLVFIPPGADRPALRGVSFSVEPGEVLGVIGSSAAGKSTLLRLVAGVESPSAGSVTLDGYATSLWDRADLATHVGMMPQHAPLPDATIAETIARLGAYKPAAVIAAAKAAGLHRVIGSLPFGYATPLAEAGFMLSGGQRQRLALARALFGEPCLVLLDEPDAQLDADGEATLAEVVAALKARGAAVVLTTHRPAVAGLADKLLLLNQGLVERSGPAAQVLRTLHEPPVRLLREAVA